MKTSVSTQWTQGMSFESNIDNHKIAIDSAVQFGGQDKGPSPKKLLLTGLAGCTGMDVVSILQKMRQEMSFFNIIVEADMTEEHPKYYNKITIKYQFKKSDNLDSAKVDRAIELSQQQYCGVAFMFRHFAAITHEVEYLD